MLKASATGRGSTRPTPKTSGVDQTPRTCQRPAAAIGRIWSVSLRVRLQFSHRRRARPRRDILERPNQRRSLPSDAPLHGAERAAREARTGGNQSGLSCVTGCRTLGPPMMRNQAWRKRKAKKCKPRDNKHFANDDQRSNCCITKYDGTMSAPLRAIRMCNTH
jgi:hypothetical protein